MPKLNQQQVEAARAQGYEDKKPVERKPLPVSNGEAYVYKLVACTSGPAQSNPNKIQWTWELQLDNRYHPELCNGEYLEKVWHYTDVTKEWAIAKMLHAFGYSPDTDTDELINDEATVLAYLTVESYQSQGITKSKMVGRRFAQHYEDDVPKAVPPMLAEAQATMAGYAAQGSEHPASVANPTGHYNAPQASAQAPADDPWAGAGAVLPPQATGSEEDPW